MWLDKLLVFVLAVLLVSIGSVEAATLDLISLTQSGQANNAYFPAVSTDGKWAAFSSYDPTHITNNSDIYIRNLDTGTLEKVSLASDGGFGNGVSQRPSISADGRFVVFESLASNLVPGDVNGACDVFVRDRLLGTTEIVSLDNDGTQGTEGSSTAAISADGRFVVFNTRSNFTGSDATIGFGAFLRDRQAQTTTYISSGIFPALSGSGRIIVSREGKNLVLRDLQAGVVEIVAQFGAELMNTNPNAYIPAISSDGRYVVYEGWSAPGAPLSTEVFVYDRLTRSNQQITRAYDGGPLTTASSRYGSSLVPRISADGRFVLFFSSAADLVKGISGNRLYLHDLANKSTVVVPINNPWATCLYPLFNLSGDGTVIVFQDTIINHQPQYATSFFGIFALRSGSAISGDNNPVWSVEPVISATPGLLWPPNGKLTDVKLSVAAPGATQVEIRIVDEYGTFTQTVHGADATVKLEASRNGADKDGRTYTITAVATNAVGQTKTATTTVSVPRDQH